MNRFKGFALCFAMLALALTGCAIGNAEITDKNKVSQIQEGKTTKKEVQALLGEPDSVFRDNGEEIWTYNHAKTSAKAYIPIIGTMFKDKFTANNLTIKFDRRGIVVGIYNSKAQG